MNVPEVTGPLCFKHLFLPLKIVIGFKVICNPWVKIKDIWGEILWSQLIRADEKTWISLCLFLTVIDNP